MFAGAKRATAPRTTAAKVTFDGTTHFVNASSMNEHYQCIHAPLVFEACFNLVGQVRCYGIVFATCNIVPQQAMTEVSKIGNL